MAMTFYSGFEYLLIDAATHYGHDKLTFEERIQWSKQHLSELENKASEAETRSLYMKAIMAIRKAQQGLPTGHLVGLDASCSGIQIMSVITGCVAGAEATGLVNPNVRADAYTACTEAMNRILGSNLVVARADAKQSLMTSFYGSRAEPIKLFGEDTPELFAFYDAAKTIAPGAWELLQDLLNSWRPYALEHTWKMPDGFDVRIKVMQKETTRIEVDELNHATFTYEYYENKGSKSGLSNAANVTHSIDAYVLRSMNRRCNYNREVAEDALALIEIELLQRLSGAERIVVTPEDKAGYYVEQYERSTIADITILPYLNQENLKQLSKMHLRSLAKILNGMLQYQPFELVTIHDEFKAHANNMNWVRWQYKEILAELADSDLLSDLLSQVYKQPGLAKKLSNDLGEKIRESAYALC